MHINHTSIDRYRLVIAGMLVVLGVRIVIELLPTWYIVLGALAIMVGVLLARVAAKHFGHHHHHAGDSMIDAIPVAVLLFANTLHPAIDGFSAVETFGGSGSIVGILYVLSIILHEVIRQSAFVSALEPLHINWKWIVGTALIGTLGGVAAALGGASLFGRYELAADIATLFSYTFVIAEFGFVESGHKTKGARAVFVLGVVLGLILVFLTRIHGAH